MRGMDDLQSLIEQMAAGEWDGIDKPEELLKAAREREERMDAEQRAVQARIVRDALTTPAGRTFFAWLLQKTILLPLSEAERAAATSADAYAIAKARREGRDMLMRTIMDAMAYQAEPMETKE